MSSIFLGASLDEATNKCGSADKEYIETMKRQKQETVEEWVYHYPPNSGFMGDEKLIEKQNALVVDFIGDQAINIESEGKPLNNPAYCRSDSLIHIGDTKQHIAFSCLYPSEVKTIEKTINQDQVNQVTLVYNQGSYIPSVRLIFENSKLIEIKQDIGAP